MKQWERRIRRDSILSDESYETSGRFAVGVSPAPTSTAQPERVR